MLEEFKDFYALDDKEMIEYMRLSHFEKMIFLLKSNVTEKTRGKLFNKLKKPGFCTYKNSGKPFCELLFDGWAIRLNNNGTYDWYDTSGG